MTALALAYSIEDLATAQQLAGALPTEWAPIHLAVTRDNDGALLAEQLGSDGGTMLFLLTPSFLTNPNCLLRLETVLQDRRCLAVQQAVALGQRGDRLRYVSHWQDRYIDLRRGLDPGGEGERAAFERYLHKIRETSIGVPNVLDRLGEFPLLDWPESEPVDAAAIAALLTDSAPAFPAPLLELPDTREVIDRAWEEYDGGRLREGLDLLQQATELQTEHTDLRYQYALMLALADDGGPAAREQLDEVLDDDPYYPDGLFLSGELHAAAGDPERARNDYERLYDLAPEHTQLRERLGLLLAEAYPDEVATADTYLGEAATEQRLSAGGYYGYAQLLRRLKEPLRAREMLMRCVAEDSAYAPAYYLLAVLAYETGDGVEAREYFARVAKLEPAYGTAANLAAFAPEESVASEEDLPPPPLSEEAPETKSELVQVAAAGVGEPTRGTVLISGASSGIGRATARRLARDGYRLILLGRRRELLETLGEELRQAHGTESHLVQLDVSDRAAVVRLPTDLPEAWRRVDVLLNNAGKAKGFAPIYAGDLDHWDEMIDVNLRGLLYLTRAITPGMVERQGGMVVNVASTAGKEVYPNGNVYCATKHAVDALTYAMRLDLVKYGIRVGQICPAHVEETEFAVVRFDGDRERAKIYEGFQPLRASDVANAIAFMVNQPPHVNVMDMVLQGTQQASSTVIERSGRDRLAPKE